MFKTTYFPLAFMSNSLAMTGLLIVIGISGLSELASDIAIIQGITLALFSSFSANSRNLILKHINPVSAHQLLYYRLILLLPLSAIGYWVSSISHVNTDLAVILLLRKSIEWLDEIYLSEMERLGYKRNALHYLIMQAFLLTLALVWMINMPFPFLGIFLWACLPLLLTGSFYYRILRTRLELPLYIIKRIFPHIGSSAIIGITVYVFRLLMVDLLGKTVAGDLFVAFAIGGILGSIVANAFGPTIVLAQSHSKQYSHPSSLKILMFLFFSFGIFFWSMSSFISILNKSAIFWEAIGFSMMGAVPMVVAQLIRHRLLQAHGNYDLFGPDVLMNVILVAVMPLMFYLGNGKYLAAMYLVSATLAWLFYKSYEAYELNNSGGWRKIFEKLKPLTISLLILPIFFQFGSGVFASTDLYFDSNRSISKLPIPFSVIANFMILLSMGAYSRARVSLIFIFLTFISMTIALILSTSAGTIVQESKFIQIAQFTLPMFALISGQFIEEKKNRSALIFEKVFFYTILIIVSLQVLLSLWKGSSTLIPSLGFFSIYQYLHYVPIMLVLSYMFVFESLWHKKNNLKLLMFLWLLLAVYSVMTNSLFIIVIYLLSVVTYISFYGKFREHKTLRIFLSILLIAVSAFTYYQHFYLISNYNHGFNTVSLIAKAQYGWNQKISGWQSYSTAIFQHPLVFLIGQTNISNNVHFGNPHNYYLNFIYNFGIIGLLPLIALIAFTAKKTILEFSRIINDSKLLFPLITLIFLLFIENMFYTGLKQPYPGVLSFFLWGIYLSRLNNKKHKNES